MPYETIHGGRVDNPNSTALSVHWTKGSHVQVHLERGDSIVSGQDYVPNKSRKIDQPVPEVARRDTCPGTVRVGPDGQIACKVRDRVDYGTDGHDGGCWVIVTFSEPNTWSPQPQPLPPPAGWIPDTKAELLNRDFRIDTCSEGEVYNWPIVHYGPQSGQLPRAEVWSEVLERGQLNSMIRSLRKARDDAYGADA